MRAVGIVRAQKHRAYLALPASSLFYDVLARFWCIESCWVVLQGSIPSEREMGTRLIVVVQCTTHALRVDSQPGGCAAAARMGVDVGVLGAGDDTRRVCMEIGRAHV